MSRWMLALAIVALAAYLATGIYTVAENEVGVVRRFGRFDPPLREPGLHFGLPWGLDRVDRIKPREVKRLTVGMRGAADRLLGMPATSPLALFLTGDQNLVVVQAVVQYSVSDPVAYLFATSQPEKVLASLTVSVLSEVLATRQIDYVLTTGKAEIAAAALALLQRRVARQGLGIAVRDIALPVVEAPAEVKDAFDDVNAARAEAETMVVQARRYADQQRLTARAQANALRQRARAEAAELRNRALAEADRFRKLLYEYRQQPSLVTARLFFDTLGRALANVRRTIVVDDRHKPVDIGVLRPIENREQPERRDQQELQQQEAIR